MLPVDEAVLAAVYGAVKTVGSTCLLYVLGSTLVFQKIVDRQFLKTLAALANVFFVPAFRFSYVGRGVTIDLIVQNWLPVVYASILFIMSLVVAMPLAAIAQPTKAFRPWFTLSVAFPNIIALPLVIVEAMCRGEHDASGPIEECISHATVGLILMTLTSTLVLWGVYYPYVMLNIQAEKEGAQDPTEDSDDAAKELDRVSFEQSALGDTHNASQRSEELDEEKGAFVDRDGVSAKEDVEVHVVAEPEANVRKMSEPFDRKNSAVTTVSKIVWWLRAVLLQPTVIADVAGLVVAVAGLAHFLFGPAAPLGFATVTLLTVGRCAAALTNLIPAFAMGFQLLEMKAPRWRRLLFAEGLGMSRRTLGCLVVSRIVVIPTLNVLVLRYFLWDYLPRDRWIRILMLIQPAGPTANFVSILAHLCNQPAAAELIALAMIPQLLLYIPAAMTFLSLGIYWTQDLA